METSVSLCWSVFYIKQALTNICFVVSVQIRWKSSGQIAVCAAVLYPGTVTPQPAGRGLHWLLLYLPLYPLHHVHQTGNLFNCSCVVLKPLSNSMQLLHRPALSVKEECLCVRLDFSLLAQAVNTPRHFGQCVVLFWLFAFYERISSIYKVVNWPRWTYLLLKLLDRCTEVNNHDQQFHHFSLMFVDFTSDWWKTQVI